MRRPAVRVSDESIQRFLRLGLCARRDPTALAAARELTAQGAVSWETVTEAAVAQRVAPLLYQSLRGQNWVPAPVIQTLRAAYDYTARRNLFLFSELALVLHPLSEQGVLAILLKGAALAPVIYVNPALRPLRDFDLLVPRDQVARAQQALMQLGYSPPNAEIHPGATISYESQMLFVKPGAIPTPVEIHWSLIDSPYYQQRLPLDWFWQTALPLAIGAAPTLTLGPEAQVLYLCAHLLLHHGGEDILWLNDIAELVRFYQARLDWRELIQRARAMAFSLPAQKILTRVASEWGAPIPAQVLGELRALPVSREEARVLNAFAVPQRPPAERLWTDLQMMPDWRARWRFAWTNIFPSRVYMQRRYHIPHPALLFFYYPYRWWLGVREALSRRFMLF